jgi:hypothetical protein
VSGGTRGLLLSCVVDDVMRESPAGAFPRQVQEAGHSVVGWDHLFCLRGGAFLGADAGAGFLDAMVGDRTGDLKGNSYQR